MLEEPDPVDGEERYRVVHLWFDKILIAELYALNERFAFDKLRPVQGSVVPWFYVHTPERTGSLLIDGCELTSDFIRSMSLDNQIAMIKACRHAARVLDVAEICQKDCHPGQILICAKPNIDVNYAVLIDFSMTTQTWTIDAPNRLDTYYGVLRLLAYGDVGFHWKFAWEHFDEPDDWDPIRVSRSKSSESDERVILKARDMFPYIPSA